jgi:hypothetical protein
MRWLLLTALCLFFSTRVAAQDDLVPAFWGDVDAETIHVLAICLNAESGAHWWWRDRQGVRRSKDRNDQEQILELWALYNNWQIRKLQTPAVTLAQHARAYCRIFDDETMQRAGPWKLELPANGLDRPPSWTVERTRVRWERYQPFWAETLQRVRDWCAGKYPDSYSEAAADGMVAIAHWGAPTDSLRGKMILLRASQAVQDSRANWFAGTSIGRGGRAWRVLCNTAHRPVACLGLRR